ncbi:MAG: Minf_1886 family protein [Planctomycetota bacterium]|jgi:uncharacterized repeat protein (TIGR04138 family)
MSAGHDVLAIAARYGSHPAEAYLLVCDGLRQASADERRHLHASELVDGVLTVAAERYGLLAWQVLRSWNLSRSEDIGTVTYQLIDEGVFGQRPDDHIEDFATGQALRPRLLEIVDDMLERRLTL